MPRFSVLLATAVTIGLAAVQVQAQADDVIWHNRYHALLAMGVYGDWRTLCPEQTCTQEGLEKNFPDSPYVPWTVLDTWGPTEHGSEGFTAFIPEMDKVTLVFKGDYNLEKDLPTVAADITNALNLGDACVGCKANAFALAGFLEAVEATNGFEKAVAKWKEIGCYFSVTGHGLGGAHSLLATLYYNKMIEFSHNFGTPRVLNPAAANYFNYLLGGYQIDRGAANADIFMSTIPQSDDWAFANTGIWYHGYNETYKMNMVSCIEQPEDAACLPQGELNELDHYFYMSNVGQCGGAVQQDTSIAEAYIAEQMAKGTVASVSEAPASDGLPGRNTAASGSQPAGHQVTSVTSPSFSGTLVAAPNSANASLPSNGTPAATSIAAVTANPSVAASTGTSASASLDAMALRAASEIGNSVSSSSSGEKASSRNVTSGAGRSARAEVTVAAVVVVGASIVALLL